MIVRSRSRAAAHGYWVINWSPLGLAAFERARELVQGIRDDVDVEAAYHKLDKEVDENKRYMYYRIKNGIELVFNRKDTTVSLYPEKCSTLTLYADYRDHVFVSKLPHGVLGVVCEKGGTKIIVRCILNKPYRPQSLASIARSDNGEHQNMIAALDQLVHPWLDFWSDRALAYSIAVTSRQFGPFETVARRGEFRSYNAHINYAHAVEYYRTDDVAKLVKQVAEFHIVYHTALWYIAQRIAFAYHTSSRGIDPHSEEGSKYLKKNFGIKGADLATYDKIAGYVLKAIKTSKIEHTG